MSDEFRSKLQSTAVVQPTLALFPYELQSELRGDGFHIALKTLIPSWLHNQLSSEVPFATASTTSTTSASRCPAGYKCGSGTISSPNYPGSYGHYRDVVYHLMASSPDSVVLLKFASIYTEKDDARVTVYDGNVLNSRVLKTYTGSYPSAELVQSTGQYMTVRLTTGNIAWNRGFTATFSSQNKH